KPIAASRPSGGTTTATIPASRLGKLVRGRTVAMRISDSSWAMRTSIVRSLGTGSTTELRLWSNSGSMRIAVVGSGIAGLGAAWALARAHEVVVYERECRAGGHVNTVDHLAGGRRVPLDTGFIV